MSLPSENSIFCDVCGDYNVDVICPECLKRLLEKVKYNHINVDDVLDLYTDFYIEKENFRKLEEMIWD